MGTRLGTPDKGARRSRACSRTWKGQAGFDKFDAWRQKGEAYQLVQYKIERRYKAWVPIRDDADDQSVESVDTVLSATAG